MKELVIKKINRIKLGEDIYTIIIKKIDGCHGECDVDGKEITLSTKLKDMALTLQIETVFHELAHAIASHFDLDSDFQRGKFPEKEFDRIIDFSAKGLLMVMLDNLPLFELIIKALKKELQKSPSKTSSSRRH